MEHSENGKEDKNKEFTYIFTYKKRIKYISKLYYNK